MALTVQEQKQMYRDDTSRALITMAISYSQRPIFEAEPALRELLAEYTTSETVLLQSFFHVYLASAYFNDEQYSKARAELKEANRKRQLHSSGSEEWVKMCETEVNNLARALGDDYALPEADHTNKAL